MRTRGKLALLGIACAISLAGCDDSTQRTAKVRAPAQTPQPALQSEQLPLTARPSVSVLNSKPRPAIEALIDSVQASYEAGKKDYQDGKIDKARQDFDHATDLIMASGFAVDSDPRLAELFDHIADTIHGYETQARESAATSEGEAGEEQGVAEGEPAPIEEIADMDLPTSMASGLAAMAEQELMVVPHDIPLTLNESVLSYLAYFQTARGQATVENGLLALRAISRDDPAGVAAGGHASRFDLSGAGGKRLPAASGIPGRSSRHMAVHAGSAARNTTWNAISGLMNGATRRNPPGPPRAICAISTGCLATGTW